MKLPTLFTLLVMVSCTQMLSISSLASDYTLSIFGNANMDDTIDEDDVAYVEGIIAGTNEETHLADADYDGVIDEEDITQIEQIINGVERELTIMCNPPYGKVVTVHKPIERIALLGTDQGQAIRSIGAKDKVVGVTSHMATTQKAFYPDLSTLPVIGGPFDPNCEAILNVRPDIVICYTTCPDPDTLEEQLEGTNVPVVRLDCNKPDTLSEDLKLLGYLLDKKNNAEELIDWYEGYIDDIKSRTEGLLEVKQPRVLLLRYNKNFEYATITNQMVGHQFCTMAGGVNIAADLPGKVPEVDPEWLLVQNPDVIVYATSSSKASCGYDVDDPSELREYRDQMMSDPVFSKCKAVESEKVYLLSSDLWSEPDYFVGVTYMAKWFYPELFEDLDPEAIHQEYLTRFQGLDYDLDEQGVFVYPPLDVS